MKWRSEYSHPLQINTSMNQTQRTHVEVLMLEQEKAAVSKVDFIKIEDDHPHGQFEQDMDHRLKEMIFNGSGDISSNSSARRSKIHRGSNVSNAAA